LRLASPVPQNENVTVQNPGRKLWPEAIKFVTNNDARRWSPTIHVNETGYLPDQTKKAEIGYYLGSLGELALGPDRTFDPGKAPPPPTFELLVAASGKSAFKGSLAPRLDRGFPYDCYQQVFEA